MWMRGVRPNCTGGNVELSLNFSSIACQYVDQINGNLLLRPVDTSLGIVCAVLVDQAGKLFDHLGEHSC